MKSLNEHLNEYEVKNFRMFAATVALLVVFNLMVYLASHTVALLWVGTWLDQSMFRLVAILLAVIGSIGMIVLVDKPIYSLLSGFFSVSMASMWVMKMLALRAFDPIAAFGLPTLGTAAGFLLWFYIPKARKGRKYAQLIIVATLVVWSVVLFRSLLLVTPGIKPFYHETNGLMLAVDFSLPLFAFGPLHIGNTSPDRKYLGNIIITSHYMFVAWFFMLLLLLAGPTLP